MRRIFKTRDYCRWMRKTELTDVMLCDAVDEMLRGLINGDLGGGVLKKRVALPGRGKRGSVRTLVVTNKGDRWFFVFGFNKNERDDIRLDEKRALKMLAEDLLKLSEMDLESLIREERIKEICHER